MILISAVLRSNVLVRTTITKYGCVEAYFRLNLPISLIIDESCNIKSNRSEMGYVKCCFTIQIGKTLQLRPPFLTRSSSHLHAFSASIYDSFRTPNSRIDCSLHTRSRGSSTSLGATRRATSTLTLQLRRRQPMHLPTQPSNLCPEVGYFLSRPHILIECLH